jgi:hypothetical protein
MKSSLLGATVLALTACSHFSTLPTNLGASPNIVSITSSQDTMSIGALYFTTTIAIVDTTLQASVTIRNDSTATVTSVCGKGIGLALFQDVSRLGTPVLEFPQSGDFCQGVTGLAPGTATWFTEAFPLSQIRKIPLGNYYVAARLISSISDFADTVTVNAGAINVTAVTTKVTTSRQHIVSLTSSQDTMSRGDLHFTATIGLVATTVSAPDTVLHITVGVQNDGKDAVSSICGGMGDGILLYQDASRSGDPVWVLPGSYGQGQMGCGDQPAGQGSSWTLTFPLALIRQAPPGNYYVAARLMSVNGAPIALNAGRILVRDL